MEATTRRDEILSLVFEKSMLITPGAASLLETVPDYTHVIEKASEKGFFVITEDVVKEILEEEREEEEDVEEISDEAVPEEKPVEVVKTHFKPLAKEYEPRIRFFDEYDVTGKSYCEGKVDDFVEYFRDRFQKLSGILSKRPLSLRPLSRVDKASPGQEVDVIGMVYDVRESRNGNIIIEIEDTEDRMVAIVTKNGEKELLSKISLLLPDDVVALRGTVSSGGMFIVRDIFWPDVDEHVPHYSDTGLAVAITSDWHVGSRLFIEKAMDRFIRWLKGDVGGEKSRDLAGRVKYLIINGDVVDGVGIYPSQIDELVIKDIYGQYEAFAELLDRIPDYIEIIVGPGNHDAVRRLEPQPALDRDVAEPLFERDNVHLVGSPSYYALEGVEIMSYHGTSMDDVISRIPSLDYTEPEKALIEYLRRRHLVPSYGLKQPIVPEKRDYMLIERVPDILTCGHVHKNGYARYKGVKLVVSGTFQDQTPFQLEHGHVPTPGVIPVVRLDDHSMHQIKVYGGNGG